MALELSIITIRDIFQDEAGKKSRFSEDYKSQSALIILDKQDLAGLGAKEGEKLLVKNDVGSIVVSARASEDTHLGLAFMRSSPWSNQLEGDESCPAGASGFRGIRAVVSPSSEGITQMDEILQRLRA